MKRATLITILFATVAVYGCSSGDGDGTAGSGGTAGTGGSGTAGTGGSGTAGTGGSGTAGTGGSGTAGTGGSGTAGTGGSGTAGTGGSGTAGTGGSGTAGTGGSGTAGTGGSGTAGTGGSGTAGTGGSAGAGGTGVDVVYAQDFEDLALTPSTALTDDGWLGFVNVFSPDGQNYVTGYVKEPGTEQGGLAAIQEGEGGVEQGLKQLVIISDYNNNAAQTAGERVEANTFQERTIVADDVGKTITFSFGAKRGNINDPADNGCINTTNPPCDSTANAFIKTFFNPAVPPLDFEQVDTTAIPVTWNRYSVTLGPIAGDRVGATLQFGFSATASNFEPSQVFYDNVLVELE